MRPLQWLKNGLVFAPAAFGGAIDDPNVFGDTLVAFGALCLVASAVYFFNDALDAPLDRLHPYKAQRPVASGVISRSTAFVVSCILLVVGIALASTLGKAAVMGWLGAYVGANLIYSTWAKHVAILDMFVLDFGFLVRLLIGGASARVGLSQWILLVTAFAAGALVVGKRRQERVRFESDPAVTRRILSAYPIAWLDSLLITCIGAALVFYSLWSFETAETIRSSILPWTIAPVAFGLVRYGFVVQTSALGEAPERLLFEDIPISAALLTWIVSTGLSLYVL